MKEFLAMGGYAVYVWTAYALTAAVIGINVWSAKRRLRQAWISVRESSSDVERVRQPAVRRKT